MRMGIYFYISFIEYYLYRSKDTKVFRSYKYVHGLALHPAVDGHAVPVARQQERAALLPARGAALGLELLQ